MSLRYFNRSSVAPPDGRSFKQRTLQAVNRTAYDVSSYHQLIIAIDKAVPGDTITVSNVINVPKTILINKDGITVECIGLGTFAPLKSGLTLFELRECDDVSLVNIKAVKYDGNSFDLFALHEYTVQIWVASQPQEVKNISIDRCNVYSKNFLKVNILGNAPPQSSAVATDSNAWFKFANNRSYITHCVHDWDTSESGWDSKFIEADTLSFYTMTENSTVGYVTMINGTQNVIENNVLLGYVETDGNIFVFNGAPKLLNNEPFSLIITGAFGNSSGGNVITNNWGYGHCGKVNGPFFNPNQNPPTGTNAGRDLIAFNFVLEDSH